MNEDVSLSALQNNCPKRECPVFFLILLKTPGLFRVELRQQSRSKAECTLFKSSQQGTASQGHTASGSLSQVVLLLTASLRPQVFLAVFQEKHNVLEQQTFLFQNFQHSIRGYTIEAL